MGDDEDARDKLRYSCEYAKSGRSKCADNKCEDKPIPKAALRLGVETPSPFAEDKMQTKWYHRGCFFSTLKRARKPGRMENAEEDFVGFDTLDKGDMEQIQRDIMMYKSGRSGKSPSKKQAANQKKLGIFFSAPSKKAASKAQPAGGDVSGHFGEFCTLCKAVAAEPSHLKMTAIIKDYLSTFTGDAVLFFKLLLPNKNIDSRTYNLKDKSLAKILSRALGLPLADIQEDLNQGDVSLTAAKFFTRSRRIKSQPTAVLTLAEVDAFLDQLSAVGKEAEQELIMGTVLRRASPTCLQWFVRLLFHDLKMGAQAKNVLGALGPTAYDSFQSRQDLTYIVNTFHGKGKGKNTAGTGLMRSASGGNPSTSRLLTPMKPMLAEALKDFGKALTKVGTHRT
jgi:hypothetical protein